LLFLLSTERVKVQFTRENYKLLQKKAVKLVEVGFEYVTGDYDDGGKIFRKRK